METDKIINLIKERFPTHPLPEKIGADGMDSIFTQQLFSGTAWTEVSASFLKSSKNACFNEHRDLMTDQARSYYLPGYMTACLRDDPESLDIVLDLLYMELNKSQSGSNPAYHHQRFDGLTSFLSAPQKEAVAVFLQHQATHVGKNELSAGMKNEMAKAAYDSYWFQFFREEPCPATCSSSVPRM